MSKRKKSHRTTWQENIAILRALDEVDRLIREHAWAEAHQLLNSLAADHPNRADVVETQLNLAAAMQDQQGYLNACEHLLELVPAEPELVRGLAHAYLMNGLVVLAYQTFQRFLEECPEADVEEITEVQELITSIEEGLPALMAELEAEGEEGLEMAALHEQQQAALHRGDMRQVQKLGKRLQRLRPAFLPPINNMSLAYWMEGKVEQAIATAQEVLEKDPENVHALGQLTRYLCQTGQQDEAEQYAARLKAAPTERTYRPWLKKAEALSYLGDFAGVLAVVQAGKSDEREKSRDYQEALLYHLGAVAALRLGQEKEGQAYWKKALSLVPGMTLVHHNQAERKKPVGERHDPWPFDLDYWFPEAALTDLREAMQGVSNPDKLMGRLRRTLRRHPVMESTLPLLLKRGDPKGREFAVHIAGGVRSPAILDALRDFALSQNGPDDLRMMALQILQEEKLIVGRQRLWIEGEWKEIDLIGFEVYFEGKEEHSHSPQVEALALDAMDTLHEGDGKKAEALLKEALALEPEAKDLTQNLAMAYQVQGRTEEALALIRALHERDPDYLFARVHLAQEAIQQKRFEEADTLLKPLLALPRLHISEFRALCQVQMALLLARKQVEGASHWLDMWKSTEPDHPQQAHWEQRLLRVQTPGLLDRFLRRES